MTRRLGHTAFMKSPEQQNLEYNEENKIDTHPQILTYDVILPLNGSHFVTIFN